MLRPYELNLGWFVAMAIILLTLTGLAVLPLLNPEPDRLKNLRTVAQIREIKLHS